ncbi:MAG: S49 family peptidase [Geminicoccaceae bacterium]
MLKRLKDRLFEGKAPLVPVIRLSGAIGAVPGRRGGLDMMSLAAPIEAAFSNKHAKAVALSINSPGGSPVQSSLIAGRIRRLAAEKKLPVIAFVEDIAASGGYWLALAGDEIWVDRSSIVGSIGVITSGFGFTEAIAKLGIERRSPLDRPQQGHARPVPPRK